MDYTYRNSEYKELAMARTATIHIRVDEEVKNSATEVAEQMGLSLSSVVNIYLKQVALRREIPFRISACLQPNDETIAALEEGEAIASGKIVAKRYKTVDDLFADLD
jgi:DNA-damage-inducible protein J